MENQQQGAWRNPTKTCPTCIQETSQKVGNLVEVSYRVPHPNKYIINIHLIDSQFLVATTPNKVE